MNGLVNILSNFPRFLQSLSKSNISDLNKLNIKSFITQKTDQRNKHYKGPGLLSKNYRSIHCKHYKSFPMKGNTHQSIQYIQLGFHTKYTLMGT